MTQIEVSKEIEVMKTQVDKAFTTAEQAVIKSDESYQLANETLVKIRSVGKIVEEQKRNALDPANAKVKSIREFWRPFEERVSQAEAILKKAILGRAIISVGDRIIKL